jgi:excisionase family DNA binding protein
MPRGKTDAPSDVRSDDLPQIWGGINDAARALQCHQNTVRHLITRGELQCVRVGSSIRFTKQQIRDYIQSHSG